jgi:2-dehydro-3-deoxyphosphooctonate aldolase (KDO 8-P synthase)
LRSWDVTKDDIEDGKLACKGVESEKLNLERHLRTREVRAGSVRAGGAAPLLIIAGPDTLESESLALEIAGALREIAARLGVCAVFKGSYDKANRSSPRSYRGPGLTEGLRILKAVRAGGLPVTSDVHSPAEAATAAEVLDIIQIPAFLCRQNDLLRAAGATGRVVNVKKGQFLAPDEVPLRVEAATGPGTPGVLVTERGTCFGYHELVNDMKGIARIRARGIPLVFDASHSVQAPGALGDRSGGSRELIAPLARAAAGAGCDGFFFEVHPDPDRALCDGPSTLPLAELEPLLEELIAIDRIARGLSRSGQ